MNKLEIHKGQVAALDGTVRVLEKLGWKNPLNGQIDIWHDVEGLYNVNIDTPWGSVLVIVAVGIRHGKFTVPIDAAVIGANHYGDRRFFFTTNPSGVTEIV